MPFQLTMNCKPTNGILEHVVFKLLLVMHDANNYDVHICTDPSNVVTNPQSYRLILYILYCSLYNFKNILRLSQ